MNECGTEWTVGMDLGDRKNAVCVLDGSGEVSERLWVQNTAAGLREFLGRFGDPSSVLVAMETGTHSPWVSHLAESLGFQVLVGHARKLRAIWESDRKSDTKDAEQLARLARSDRQLLHPVRHRGPDAQADLAIVRARDALVRARTALVNSARGLAKSLGHRLVPCDADCFARKASEGLPPELVPALEPLLGQVASLTAAIRRYDRCIGRLCDEVHTETARLRQIQGVGPVTALAFVLTLEDPGHFPKNRCAGPFLGLVSRRDQSGDTDKALPISKAGDAPLRRLLVGAARYILGPFGPPCDLRRFGERIRERGGKAANGRAATAVARKLAVLMLKLWRDGGDYEPVRRRSARRPDGGESAA